MKSSVENSDIRGENHLTFNIMLKRLILPAILLLHFSSKAQTDERTAVMAVIQKMFDGMRTGDSAAVRSVFDPTARLLTALVDADGKPVLKSGSIGNFVEAVGTPHDEIWDERIWSFDINIEGQLATAWTEYTFFRGEIMSHCGVNAFQLFNSESGWKIIQITDTRRQTSCQTEPHTAEAAINGVLDAWHRAAAEADSKLFFGSMAPDGIYLGTDASERWLRDELREWSKKYFERGSAWDFTPRKRQVYLSADGQIAWFEELLGTWMGVCRGSGVLQKSVDGWKIKHYNLAVTVPNDAMDGFIELIKNLPENKD